MTEQLYSERHCSPRLAGEGTRKCVPNKRSLHLLWGGSNHSCLCIPIHCGQNANNNKYAKIAKENKRRYHQHVLNFSLDSQLPPSDPGGGHTIPQSGVQLLVADDNIPVPVYEQNGRHYDMRGAKYLYIFNHGKYKKTRHFWYRRPAARSGTDEDVRNLTTTFKDQGYKVATYTDLKYREIIRVVTAIANQDHSRTSILCIAILTHGENNNAVLAADRSYRLTRLEHLLQNGNLVGKPKVLLVEASTLTPASQYSEILLVSGQQYVL